MALTFIPFYRGTPTNLNSDLLTTARVTSIDLAKTALNKAASGAEYSNAIPGVITGTFSVEGHIATTAPLADLITVFESTTVVPFVIQLVNVAGPTHGVIITGNRTPTALNVSGDAEGEWDWTLSAATSGDVNHAAANRRHGDRGTRRRPHRGATRARQSRQEAGAEPATCYVWRRRPPKPAQARMKGPPGGGTHPRRAGMMADPQQQGWRSVIESRQIPVGLGRRIGARRAWVWGRKNVQSNLKRRQFPIWRGNQFVVRVRGGPGWIIQPTIRDNIDRILVDIADRMAADRRDGAPWLNPATSSSGSSATPRTWRTRPAPRRPPSPGSTTGLRRPNKGLAGMATSAGWRSGAAPPPDCPVVNFLKAPTTAALEDQKAQAAARSQLKTRLTPPAPK